MGLPSARQRYFRECSTGRLDARICSQGFGEPASVQNLPVPAADEAVLVRVRFAGVNPLDNNLLGRLNADSSYPFVVGIDFAGVAERVPAGDHGLRVGDRV